MSFCGGIPQWHAQSDVGAAIQTFYHKYAREPDSSEAKQDLLRRLDIIGSHLKEQGLPYKGNEYVGSTWEHLKISNGFEFDVMVVLGGRGVTAVPTRDPQYSMITPHPGLQPPNLNPRMMKDGVVTAEKASRTFQSCLDKLAAKHPDFSRQSGVVFRKNGPAIMMDVTTPGLRYSADLVPTYRIQDNFYVAKPRPSQPDAWLHSYSVDVKKALDGLDRDNGCRKQAGRVLKALCQKDPSLKKITSHHLKMALLSEVKENPEKSWQPKELVPRVQDVMRRMGNYIKERNFPHHFMPDVNLSKPLNPELRCRLVRLYNKEGVFRRALSDDGKPEMKSATTVAQERKAATAEVQWAKPATTVAKEAVVAGAKTAMADVPLAKPATIVAKEAVVVEVKTATTEAAAKAAPEAVRQMAATTIAAGNVVVGAKAATLVAAGGVIVRAKADKAATATAHDANTTTTEADDAEESTIQAQEATSAQPKTKKKRCRRWNRRRRRKCAQQQNESFSWGGGF